MSVALSIRITRHQLASGISGSECIFIPDVCLSSWQPFAFDGGSISWGLKVYRSLGTAARARRMQLDYAQKNLAPEVGELVRVWLPDRKTPRYAYFTEQIKGPVAEDLIGDEFNATADLPSGFFKLTSQLDKLNYGDFEQHLCNIMFDERRMRWVVVDFGPYSWKRPTRKQLQAINDKQKGVGPGA